MLKIVLMIIRTSKFPAVLPSFLATSFEHNVQSQSEEVAFAIFIGETQLENREFILLRNAGTTEFFNCTEWLFKDTTVISSRQRAEIQRKLDKPQLMQWSLERYVNVRTLKGIIKDYPNKGYPYFQKNYGKSYYIFSKPIFFSNNTMCLFYIDKHCGEFCNEGQIILYKKMNGQWTSVKQFCSWMS